MKPASHPTPNFQNYQPKKQDPRYIIKCVISIIIIISGLFSILFFNSAFSGMLRIIAGLLLLPPTLEAFEKITKIKFNRILKYVVIVILVQISFVISFINISGEMRRNHKPDSLELANNVTTQSNSDTDSLINKPDSELTEDELEQRDLKNIAEHNKLNQEFQDKYLSGLDGSFKPLVDYVKKNMNDPDSFEHVETTSSVIGDRVVVTMQFRGKNAFGAKVLDVIKANVNMDGKLISIISKEE